MSHAHILCLQCRGLFTEEETRSWGCPRCGNDGIPGDTDEQATLTLTHQEWRILFMWATNWAEGPCAVEPTPDGPKTSDSAARLLTALRAEVRRQAPKLPPLTIAEEVQQVVDQVPGVSKAELHVSGDVQMFEKTRRH